MQGGCLRRGQVHQRAGGEGLRLLPRDTGGRFGSLAPPQQVCPVPPPGTTRSSFQGLDMTKKSMAITEIPLPLPLVTFVPLMTTLEANLDIILET